ncbi:hypothetical protein C8A05DRAFT_19857, partial [Staphylotrichum tortipilum]
KTGISPFNPQLVLQAVHARQALRTPSPPPIPQGTKLTSSPFSTPITLRQINKVADELEVTLRENDDLDPSFAYNLGRFIRGSLIVATELVQTKRDLGRTKLAEATARARRNSKNTPLKTGGVLTVAQGRAMVVQRKEDDLMKARRLVDAAETKAQNAMKRVFAAAAKEARKWRVTKRLGPVETMDSEYGKRLLRRV